MPRKSNKTAHVLSLLANGESGENSEIEETKKNHETEIPDVSESNFEIPNSSTQSFIEFESSSHDPLSVLIKEELEKVAYTEFNIPLDEPENPVDDEGIIESVGEEEFIESVDEEIEIIDTEKAQLKEFQEKHASNEEFQESIVPIEIVEEKKEITEADISNEPQIKNNDSKYFCHNVMEEIVKEQLDKVVRMMNVCRCDKCRKDIMAIALNHLQPKYIVTNEGRLISRLNSFEAQYSITITTQLIKACILVKESPKH